MLVLDMHNLGVRDPVRNRKEMEGSRNRYVVTFALAAFAKAVRGEPRTRPLQPNLASGLSRERVEGRLALALRRLVSRHMGLRLVLVRFRFLFFLISFLSLRHGDPPVCSLDPPF